MLTPDMAADLPGQMLQDASGAPVGAIDEVFLNTGDDTPAWAAVRADDRTVVVPLVGAEAVAGGIRAAHDAEQIRAAPAAGPGGLDNDAQQALFAHYGLSDADIRDDSGFSADRPPAREQGTSRDPNDGSMVSRHP